MKALLLVDLQNDFVPGGALPVPRGDEVIPLANELQGRFELVVASQDWHPPNHGSFAANHPGKKPGDRIDLDGIEQILWPVHCIAHKRGADFVPSLETAQIAQVFRKGTDPRIDSYSAFFDNGHRKAIGLGDYLKARGVIEIYVAGLALDYCVKYSVLDGSQLEFKMHLIEDACRGIALEPSDLKNARDEMEKAGAIICTSDQLLKRAKQPRDSIWK